MSDSSKPRILLLVGPESSGTRVLTEQLSKHPEISGTPNASTHVDVLDVVWTTIYKNSPEEEIQAVFSKATAGKNTVLTRRSLPHGMLGDVAHYMDFPDMGKFITTAQNAGYQVHVLITTRSAAPNLLSWKKNRPSSEKSFPKAYKQYQESYRNIFSAIIAHDLEYLLLSLEALLESPTDYLNSIFLLLGLDEQEIIFGADKAVNSKHYAALKDLKQQLP